MKRRRQRGNASHDAPVEGVSPESPLQVRHSARHTRSGRAVVPKFLRAATLSPQEVRTAYPYVACLLRALAKPRPKIMRRGATRASLAHAAHA